MVSRGCPGGGELESRGRGGGVQGGEEVKFSGLRYLSLSLGFGG